MKPVSMNGPVQWEKPSTQAEVDNEIIALLNLLRAGKIGSKTVWRLLRTFGSARMTVNADDVTLERVGGLSQESVRGLREASGNGFGDTQYNRAHQLGARIVLPFDDEYSPLLKESPSPPVCLFVMGKPLPTDNKAVAIVGSRRASEAGLEIAHQIGAGLAKGGVNVISGMALGVDAAAHRGALQEGTTVAVLGCGVDTVYPRQNRKLRDAILRDGTIVSELFIGAGPEAKNFPMRNRIIAWLSIATVVVEAGSKSGALITSYYALQANRSVSAVPGHPLSPGHEGCNYLLRQGATPVRHAGDLLEDLAPSMGLELRAKQAQLPLDTIPDDLDENERKIFKLLDHVEKIHADKLADRLEIDASRLGAMLMGLEMKGYIQRLPGDHYRRVSPASWNS